MSDLFGGLTPGDVSGGNFQLGLFLDTQNAEQEIANFAKESEESLEKLEQRVNKLNKQLIELGQASTRINRNPSQRKAYVQFDDAKAQLLSGDQIIEKQNELKKEFERLISVKQRLFAEETKYKAILQQTEKANRNFSDSLEDSIKRLEQTPEKIKPILAAYRQLAEAIDTLEKQKNRSRQQDATLNQLKSVERLQADDLVQLLSVQSAYDKKIKKQDEVRKLMAGLQEKAIAREIAREAVVNRFGANRQRAESNRQSVLDYSQRANIVYNNLESRKARQASGFNLKQFETPEYFASKTKDAEKRVKNLTTELNNASKAAESFARKFSEGQDPKVLDKQIAKINELKQALEAVKKELVSRGGNQTLATNAEAALSRQLSLSSAISPPKDLLKKQAKEQQELERKRAVIASAFANASRPASLSTLDVVNQQIRPVLYDAQLRERQNYFNKKFGAEKPVIDRATLEQQQELRARILANNAASRAANNASNFSGTFLEKGRFLFPQMQAAQQAKALEAQAEELKKLEAEYNNLQKALNKYRTTLNASSDTKPFIEQAEKLEQLGKRIKEVAENYRKMGGDKTTAFKAEAVTEQPLFKVKTPSDKNLNKIRGSFRVVDVVGNADKNVERLTSAFLKAQSALKALKESGKGIFKQAEIKDAEQVVQRYRKELEAAVAEQKRVGGSTANTNKAVAALSGALDRSQSGWQKLVGGLRDVGFAIFAVQNAFYTLQGAAMAVKKVFIDTNVTLEQAQLSIAGIFNNNYAESFGESMQRAKNFVAGLREEAVKTNLTFEELLQASTTALPQLINRGATEAQAMETISRISQASKFALGSQFDPSRINDEIRALLNKQITGRTNETLQFLGITKEDLKPLKDAGDLLDLLREKSKGLEEANKEFQNSFVGAMERAQDALFKLSSEAGKPLFEAATASLQDFNNALANGSFDGFVSGIKEAGRQAAALLINLQAILKFLNDNPILYRLALGGAGYAAGLAATKNPSAALGIGTIAAFSPEIAKTADDISLKNALYNNPGASIKGYDADTVKRARGMIEQDDKFFKQSMQDVFKRSPSIEFALASLSPIEKKRAQQRNIILSLLSQREEELKLEKLPSASGEPPRRSPASPLGTGSGKTKKPKRVPTSLLSELDDITQTQSTIDRFEDKLNALDKTARLTKASLDALDDTGLSGMNVEAKNLEQSIKVLEEFRAEMTKMEDQNRKSYESARAAYEAQRKTAIANPENTAAIETAQLAGKEAKERLREFQKSKDQGQRLDKQISDAQADYVSLVFRQAEQNRGLNKDRAIRQLDTDELNSELNKGTIEQGFDRMAIAASKARVEIDRLNSDLEDFQKILDDGGFYLDSGNTKFKSLTDDEKAALELRIQLRKEELALAQAQQRVTSRDAFLSQFDDREQINQNRLAAMDARRPMFSQRQIDQERLRQAQGQLELVRPYDGLKKGDIDPLDPTKKIDQATIDKMDNIRNEAIKASIEIRDAWSVNVLEAGKNAFDQLFDSVLDGTANFKEVFMGFLKDIARQFQRIFSQNLFQILEQVLPNNGRISLYGGGSVVQQLLKPGNPAFASAALSQGLPLPQLLSVTQAIAKGTETGISNALPDTLKASISNAFNPANYGLSSAATAGKGMSPLFAGISKFALPIAGIAGAGIAAKNIIAPPNGNRAGAASGSLFGAASGAALGAGIGSIVPGIGTVVGGLVGAGIGAGAGSSLGGGLLNDAGDQVALWVGGPIALAIRKIFTSKNIKKVQNALAQSSERLNTATNKALGVDTLTDLEAQTKAVEAEYRKGLAQISGQKGKGTKKARGKATSELSAQLKASREQLAELKKKLEEELQKLTEEVDLQITDLKLPDEKRGVVPDIKKMSDELKELLRKGVDKNKIFELFNLQVKETLRQTQDELDDVNKELNLGAENKRGELISLAQKLQEDIADIQKNAQEQLENLRKGTSDAAQSILSEGRAAAINVSPATRQQRLAELFKQAQTQEGKLKEDTQNAIARETNQNTREVADLTKKQNQLLARIGFILETATTYGLQLDSSFSADFINGLKSFMSDFNPFGQLSLAPAFDGGLGINIDKLIVEGTMSDAQLGAAIRQQIELAKQQQRYRTQAGLA